MSLEYGCCCLVVVLFVLVALCVCGVVVCPREYFSSQLVQSTNSPEDPLEDRIQYYLGGLVGRIRVPYSRTQFNSKGVQLVDENILHSGGPTQKGGNQAHYNYFSEMRRYYGLLRRSHPQVDAKFVFLPGDVHHSRVDIPLLAKTRPIQDRGLNVLLPLNLARHWGPVGELSKWDRPWNQKRDCVLWRGAATGRDRRIPLVEGWRDYPHKDRIDVGFTGFLDEYRGIRDPTLVVPKMTMGEMLECKYLVSVEGNDVASNLKWILASNSVCIMPPPTTESWLMEGRLVPWVHYVPVRHDFGDLAAVRDYCVANEAKMKEIVANANAYMGQFGDPQVEDDIVVGVLKGYCDRTMFVF